MKRVEVDEAGQIGILLQLLHKDAFCHFHLYLRLHKYKQAYPPHTRTIAFLPVLSVASAVEMDAEGFPAFQEQAQAALVDAVKTTNRIASGDLAFHRSFDSPTSRSLTEQSNRLLSLTNSLLRIASANNPDSPFNASSSSASADSNARSGRNKKKKPKTVLRDEDSMEENWKDVVDVIDELLEKADACLDEFTGVIKKYAPAQEAQKKETAGFPRMYSHGSSKIAKPQLQFDVKLDNADDGRAFRPLLKSKPHALVGLEESLGGSIQDPTKP